MIRDDVISTFFGVDDERIANKLNSDADYSELKDLPASDWPVSHCAYGPDFLVNVFSSVDKSTVRREVGIKLLASNMAGLVNVDASSLVPSATDAHAARGRGIEPALWQGVLGSARGKIGVQIGTGQMVRRKSATASESHRHGVVVGLLQQTDAGANYAKWLPGLWVITAFAVERGAAAAAAAATPCTTEIVLLPRRSVEVVAPNLEQATDAFESSHNAGDGAEQMALWRTQPEFAAKVNEWLKCPVLSDDTVYA